ncbi:T9SS type A sorting domain-containing protein [uncultured Kordia sp.]|uniref:T9SS type A sorting domain-containing protein n=1 Tax=uncultured Kordia sp. TaxID=507699 RepID=UPI002617E6E1|nr:T9SS type A sorting domain-containing protein [uncultured Kordia sp.]
MKVFLTIFITLQIIYNTQAQCTDLFFSEYIEGSSFNKALEIYNPTENTIDLSDYVVYLNINGSLTPTDNLFLQGSLLSKDVYVIANPSATVQITAVADTLHSITSYNGDDAIWLKKISTMDTLDIIGEIGVDPGSGWSVGSGATNNFTLIRMPEIQKGQKDWPLGTTEWDVFPINMTDSLSSHNMSPCVTLGIHENNFTNKNLSVYPNPSSGNITIKLDKPYEVKIHIFDIMGRQVYNNNYQFQQNIDLTLNEKKGIYFIEAIFDKKRIITKLILR